MKVTATKLCKYYGATAVFSDVDFSLDSGDRVGVVGVNGAGKTTLFRIITGEEKADGGELFIGKDVKIGYLRQHVTGGCTVYQEALKSFEDVIKMEAELSALAERIASGDHSPKTVERQDALISEFNNRRGYDYRNVVRACLKGLGFTDGEIETPLDNLSGGQRTKAELARILLSGADILLLDEPTNHLDVPSVMWLEEFLKNYKGAVAVISHDRYFLDNVTNKTFAIEAGKLTVYSGNYTKFTVLREESLKTQRRVYERKKAEEERLKAAADKLRSFNKEKSVRRAENIDRRVERLAATITNVETDDREIEFGFAPEKRGGDKVLSVSGVSKSYGSKNLFTDLSLELRRGDRAFILGANGCGKTTLLKIALQLIQPDSGEVRLGSDIAVGYYEQTGENLLNGKDVFSEIADSFPRLSDGEIRNRLAAFLFTGDDVFKEVSSLSGGERARIALLKIMLTRPNLLILDEPTNHLDIFSREALERTLTAYNGTILCVSHDRYFIDKLATSVYGLSGGALKRFDGNYSAFIAEQKPQETKKKNSDYEMRKQSQAAIRKHKAAVERAERAVAEIEAKIKQKTDYLYGEDCAADYTLAAKTDAEIQALNRDLNTALELWESLAEQEG